MSSIQVILELCIPVLAIFGLVRLFNQFDSDERKLKALKYSASIVGGLALLFLLFGSSIPGIDFVGVNDGFYRQNYGQGFIDAVKEDRKSFFTQDTLRSLILVLLAAGTILMFLKNKLSEKLVIVVFTGLILFDLVGVDRRYVNSDNFVSSLEVNKPYQPNAADLEIAKDTSHFRVFDVVSREPARAAYFHNSLSGYSAAKLERFDELFNFHIANNNMNVLNMLNTKYIIADDDKGVIFPYENTDANGNAWFVGEIEKLSSANEEIKALDSLDTRIKAVTTQKLSSSQFALDSTATITLLDYQPNYLKYRSNNSNNGFAVFSEVYYGHGWKSFIDGKETPHYRVDYVLRGMPIPKGKHSIEFKFEPEVIKTGSTISLASSIILGLLIIGGLLLELRKNKT